MLHFRLLLRLRLQLPKQHLKTYLLLKRLPLLLRLRHPLLLLLLLRLLRQMRHPH